MCCSIAAETTTAHDKLAVAEVRRSDLENAVAVHLVSIAVGNFEPGDGICSSQEMPDGIVVGLG